jgi:hypothetical protein
MPGKFSYFAKTIARCLQMMAGMKEFAPIGLALKPQVRSISTIWLGLNRSPHFP